MLMFLSAGYFFSRPCLQAVTSLEPRADLPPSLVVMRWPTPYHQDLYSRPLLIRYPSPLNPDPAHRLAPHPTSLASPLPPRPSPQELDITLEHSAPLVLVHEGDEKKGGASLEALRADCTAQGRDSVTLFGSRARKCSNQTGNKSVNKIDRLIGETGHEIITWHRVAAFQQFALKRIAQGMLYATPTYRHLPSAPALYMTDELTMKVLELRRKISLYVSSANHGAREVADELVARYVDKLLTVGGVPPLRSPLPPPPPPSSPQLPTATATTAVTTTATTTTATTTTATTTTAITITEPNGGSLSAPPGRTQPSKGTRAAVIESALDVCAVGKFHPALAVELSRPRAGAHSFARATVTIQVTEPRASAQLTRGGGRQQRDAPHAALPQQQDLLGHRW